MEVEVRLFATFREGREKKQKITIIENTSILDIINLLNIDEKEVAIMLLNGRDGASDRLLNDGDIISLFPPVGGG
ncbi:MoaD/ThiS family protein [Terrisporobacter petrolearius]|uniref:Molybdopterin converting factor, small subunit n=1 Tax=Terrisporobacter petrolearius TaxID=1460447 RepID=A0ABZ3FAZ6_9FIRM|nr:MoaD/ThiS family protein [Terrisporobacter petrolearius]MBN9647882.1 MoaD/ThiS family protein [Terrisporobacter glycolicus]MCC3864264.1 MoaD/ThiS family protein [Terrisporobacter petrolearius]